MTAQSVEPLPLVPVLRLVPAPVCAPPYDDELVRAPVLRLAPAPAPPKLVLPLRALPRAPEPVIEDADDWCTPRRTPTAQLPASQPFARALVQGLLEVLAGVRPVKQLQRDTTAELYAVLEQTVGRQPRSVGPRPGARAVRSLHLQERPEGVVEVCATVERGTRAGAFALRLEGLDGRWRCTELLGV